MPGISMDEVPRRMRSSARETGSPRQEEWIHPRLEREASGGTILGCTVRFAGIGSDVRRSLPFLPKK
jgi:hypothetical protein